MPDRKLRDALALARLPVAVGAVGAAVLFGVGMVSGQDNWPVYLAVILVGAAVVTRVHVVAGLSTPTLWGLVAFALGHLAGGMVPVGEGVLYQRWLVGDVVRYDNLQHAVGFGFVGRATWEALRPRVSVPPHDSVLAAWIVVLGACAFGAVNEVVEYLLTLALPATNVGGYENTARDLVSNLLGGGAAAWWVRAEVVRTRGNGQAGT